MKVQIVISGIGGQGILFTSRVFSEWGLRLGTGVMGSETHGMSQRGGSVIAHLKLGRFYSPLIQTGHADILYSFEENETYRTLRFLKRGGICYANLLGINGISKNVLSYLRENKITLMPYDASHAATKNGLMKSLNMILVGFSVGTERVPFRYKDLRDVLESISYKKNIKMNLKAFDLGYHEGKLKKNS